MKIDKHKTHAISWIDLAAADLDGATAFYSDMMGWETLTIPGTNYTMFMTNGEPVAGAMALTPEMGAMPPVWSVYVGVEDAAATCAKAIELGGSVMQEPFDIPDGGKIAVLGDPAGAAICLFEGVADTGFRLVDEPGAPCWFDVQSRDANASVEFYKGLFNWSAEPMEGLPYHVFSQGETPIAGCMQMGDEMPPDVPSHWGVAFSIHGSIPDFMAKADEKGATPLGEPMDSVYGVGVPIRDPWGATFVAFDRSTATA